MSSGFTRGFKGWLAGCATATVVISVGLSLLLIASYPNLSRVLVCFGVLGCSPLLFFATCLLTAMPATIVGWLSERFQIRAAGFFACAGAVTGALIISLLIPRPEVWTSGLGCIVAAVGFVAGVAYWLVVRDPTPQTPRSGTSQPAS